jgi:hypothetical protein
MMEEMSNCVPRYKWTATSTDEDDDEDSLSYHWKIEYYEDDEWKTINESDEKIYWYQFQYEGYYRITLTTTDANGDSDEKQETIKVEFRSCDSTGNNNGDEVDTCTKCGKIVYIYKDPLLQTERMKKWNKEIKKYDLSLKKENMRYNIEVDTIKAGLKLQKHRFNVEIEKNEYNTER